MIHSLSLSSKRIVGAALCFFCAVFIALVLWSFDVHDVSYFYDVGAVNDFAHTSNFFGVIGAYGASFLLFCFGCASFLLIPFFIILGLMIAGVRTVGQEWSRLVGVIFLLFAFATVAHDYGFELFQGVFPGGACGVWCQHWLVGVSDVFIEQCASIGLLAVGLVLVVRFSWVRPLYRILGYAWCYSGLQCVARACVRLVRARKGSCADLIPGTRVDASDDELEKIVQDALQFDEEAAEEHAIFDDPFWRHYELDDRQLSLNADCGDEFDFCSAKQENDEPSFDLPDAQLFCKTHSSVDEAARRAEAEERAHNLEKKLELFGISGSVESITIGPVVTLFEYAPASDVKVSRILALEDDLSLALQALSLRIIAPIPGKSLVGFEVANALRETVHFSDIIKGESFTATSAALPLVIGRDTVGKDVVVDLADMPHLLVAGSTGSGKSVALNAMLVSLLCSKTPDELQLILIDPKRLEFAAFADIAHLLFPIVTEVDRICAVLRWAVTTMEERYDELAQAGVRNVHEYQERYGIEAMPNMVIVIDELADLMITSGREVEELIARLAQMARAAGIHMIIATQRPSVDVITGLIKVNFPSRIAFKVTSKIDSRTILDCSGAEKLLGKGDMLFLNQKGFLVRVHGAYVRDSEIESVVEHIKQQRDPEYQEELSALVEAHDENLETDPLYDDVVSFVQSVDQVSISLLQRKFRIGYNRSARIIDMLEDRGVISPADGGKLRKVYH